MLIPSTKLSENDKQEYASLRNTIKIEFKSYLSLRLYSIKEQNEEVKNTIKELDKKEILTNRELEYFSLKVGRLETEAKTLNSETRRLFASNKMHGMESSEGMVDLAKKAKKYGKKGKKIVDAATDIAKTMDQENPQEVAGCGMDSSSDESDSEMKLCDECGEMDDHFHVCAEVCEKPPCLTHGIAERKMSELSI